MPRDDAAPDFGYEDGITPARPQFAVRLGEGSSVEYQVDVEVGDSLTATVCATPGGDLAIEIDGQERDVSRSSGGLAVAGRALNRPATVRLRCTAGRSLVEGVMVRDTTPERR